jgi:hypothetical protein
LLNRRFNQQTLQLDLSHLADDEGKKIKKFNLYLKTMKLIILELSSLGIFPQLNKQAFIREIVAVINKYIQMVRINILFFFISKISFFF